LADEFGIDVNNLLPLREVVFNSMRDAIIMGKLKPGERLIENQISEKIGVSRTPVREAFRKLELEGFIEIVPRKGAIVKVLEKKDIEEVLQIRSVLEGLASRLACENMTLAELNKLKKIKKEFMDAVEKDNLDLMLERDVLLHDLIIVSSKNKRLVQMVNNLKEQIYRLRFTYLRDESSRQQIILEHSELVNAILSKDANKAEEISMRHIRNQEIAVTDYISKNEMH